MHRDIKPGNIIFRGNILGDIVLVDFGMSYHEEASANVTPTGEEVGNRFLHLPELACESSLKRDPRSDVTFCGGILFFLLTGVRPVQLSDQDGRMPHQRLDAVSKLASHAGLDTDHLLALFDRAFDFRIDHRFQDAGALADAIDGCVIRQQAARSMDVQATMERIKTRVSSPAEVAIRQKMDLLRHIILFMQQITEDLCETLGGAFGRYLTGWAADPGNLHVRYTIGLELRTDSKVRFAPTYHARIVGNEIVLMADQTTIYRCDTEKVDYNKMKADVVSYIVAHVDTITAKGGAGS